MKHFIYILRVKKLEERIPQDYETNITGISNLGWSPAEHQGTYVVTSCSRFAQSLGNWEHTSHHSLASWEIQYPPSLILRVDTMLTPFPPSWNSIHGPYCFTWRDSYSLTEIEKCQNLVNSVPHKNREQESLPLRTVENHLYYSTISHIMPTLPLVNMTKLFIPCKCHMGCDITHKPCL